MQMAKIEVFNLNDGLLQNYDYNGIGNLEMGLVHNLGPMVNSILMHGASFASSNILAPCTLDLEVEIAWKLLKT